MAVMEAGSSFIKPPFVLRSLFLHSPAFFLLLNTCNYIRHGAAWRAARLRNEMELKFLMIAR